MRRESGVQEKFFELYYKFWRTQDEQGGQWMFSCPVDSRIWREKDMRDFVGRKPCLGDRASPTARAVSECCRLVTSSHQLHHHISSSNPGPKSSAKVERVLEGARVCVHEPANAEEAAYWLRDEPLLESSLDPDSRKRADRLVRMLRKRLDPSVRFLNLLATAS